METFILPKGAARQYTQQFADMYFLRLAMLKPTVEQIAGEIWDGFEAAGEKAKRAERVLDVRQGELCWIVGTIFMDMPLKPNVLDDLTKEHWIAQPPPRNKYLGKDSTANYMIEDESGRLKMTGAYLNSVMLVTGAIVAAMGTENADGAFNVIDMKVADLPRQPARWERDDGAEVMNGKKVEEKRPKSGKVALVSGLGIDGIGDDMLRIDMLCDYLMGEAGNANEAARISRLIIAGNSLSNSSPIMSREEFAIKKPTGSKKFGYDGSMYDPEPMEALDLLLSTILPSIPITIMPGATDPAPVSLPQQPIHPAIFPYSKVYIDPPIIFEEGKKIQAEGKVSWLSRVTNPWQGDIDGWRMMGNGGQPIDDIFKYIPGDDRLAIMEQLLRWRNGAPTAPDTLWTYPFQDDDPFMMRECPHVFFVGNQPRFETTVIEGPLGQSVRLIMVPKFEDTGVLVLLDMETLEPECVQFRVRQKSGAKPKKKQKIEVKASEIEALDVKIDHQDDGGDD